MGVDNSFEGIGAGGDVGVKAVDGEKVNGEVWAFGAGGGKFDVRFGESVFSEEVEQDAFVGVECFADHGFEKGLEGVFAGDLKGVGDAAVAFDGFVGSVEKEGIKVGVFEVPPAPLYWGSARRRIRLGRWFGCSFLGKLRL